MTDAELDAIEKACAEATPGPWEYEDYEVYSEFCIAALHECTQCVRKHHDRAQHERDGTFIASARSWVPALVAEVRRLRALTKELREEYRNIGTDVRNQALEEAAKVAEVTAARIADAIRALK